VQRPDPAKWSAALAVCAVQATQGLRPPLKLHRWATPTVCESIRLLALAASRRTDSVAAKPRPHARRVRVTTLSPGVLEAAVVINEGDKVHAVAIRLHWRRDVWYATELTLL
jgi:hypothetical protein